MSPHRRIIALVGLLSTFTMLFRLGVCGETGDLDGDGRVTLADYLRIRKFVDAGTPVAPGSLDGFQSHSCWENEFFNERTAPLQLYLESLFRMVEDALPPWDGVWPDPVKNDPLPEDPRVTVSITPFYDPALEPNHVALLIEIVTSETLQAVSLLLDSDEGILRMPGEMLLPRTWNWDGREWRRDGLNNTLATAFLTSGGHHVALYNHSGRLAPIPPGSFQFTSTAYLPQGTRPGTYRVHLAQGSQVVLEDGSVVAPRAENNGEFAVDEEVTTGWNQGRPPLRVDLQGRRVLGALEFRVVDAQGRPAAEGESLLTVRRGDEFVLKLQMRTETPLNFISYQVSWPVDTFICAGNEGLTNGDGLVFTNPEDGQRYRPSRDQGYGCASLSPWPHFFSGSFYLAGHQADAESTYPDRIFEYFKPLGEWVDVREFRLGVSDYLKPGNVPLVLGIPSGFRHGPQFTPYGEIFACSEEESRWNYDYVFHNTAITVVGDDPPPPPPPPTYGLEVVVGDAVGQPGGLVEVPVLARADVPLDLLRVAVAVDSEVLDVEKITVAMESGLTGEIVQQEATRGHTAMLFECTPLGSDCSEGYPFMAHFKDSGPEVAIVDILPHRLEPRFYPGANLVEVFKIVVRVREGATAAEAILIPGKVNYLQEGFPVEVEPAGSLLDETSIFPASVLRSGVITIHGPGFLRGDSNLDGEVNISDPILLLDHLFLAGTVLECRDAADADDSGELDITDAVTSLGALFLGQGAIPPPYPDCGMDEKRDFLGCRRSNCQ